MKVCCKQMLFQLKDERVAISYSPKYRSYSIDVIDWWIPIEEIKTTRDLITAQQDIIYCPWCGKKLPKNLSDKWFKTLEKEYGIENPFDDKRKIPLEFRSDKWWKKRGL